MAIIKKEGPEWLQPFLAADYFSHCKHHASGKNERNHFCIDCLQGPLCSSALHQHSTHRTLQIRKASHMDAVRINDIQTHLDISDIQSYTINGAKIIFLRSRPHSKATKLGFGLCEICGRSIADPVRFCSISCKLSCSKQNLDHTSLFLSEGFNALMMEQWQMDHLQLPWKKFKLQKFTPKVKNDYPSSPDSYQKSFSSENLGADASQNLHLFETQPTNFAPSTPESGELLSFRVRSRKGTPHRAPLS